MTDKFDKYRKTNVASDLSGRLSAALNEVERLRLTLKLTESMCAAVIEGKAEMFIEDDRLKFRLVDDESSEVP